MAKGKDDSLAKWRASQPSVSSAKPTKKFGTGNRFGSRTAQVVAPQKFSPGRALENAASAFFDYIFPKESARKLARGEGLDEAGALALASLVPLPVGTALKGAGAVAKGAKGRLTQPIAEAVGESGVKIANEAAGMKVPNRVTKPSTPKPAKKPGPMPVRDSYSSTSSFSRAMNNWQKRVGDWNKQNPKDKIKLPSDRPAGAPGKGKASRDTARQMRESEQRLTPSEKDAVTKGKRSDKGIQEEVEALSPAPTTGFDPRFGGTGEAAGLPKGVSKDRVQKFVKGRQESLKGGQPKGTKRTSEKVRREAIPETIAQRLASPEARLDLGAQSVTAGKPTTAQGRKLRTQSNANQRNRPQPFTSRSGKRTPLQEERSAANRARFDEAGAKMDRKAELDPAIRNPQGPELARQQQAEAVGYADRVLAQKRMAFNEMSGGPRFRTGQYGPDEVRLNPRMEGSVPRPSGMPREAADRVAARQRELFPDRTMTASGASQPKPPSPDPRMGLRDEAQRPVQRFTNQMTDEDYKAAGYVQVEQRIVDDAGNVSFRKVWMKPDMDVYIGGADTPPSLGPRSKTPKETGSTRASGYRDRNPNLGRFETPTKPTSAPEGPKPKGGKKPKTQPAATAADDIESIRARNYEQYLELEKKGILQPGDADLIMGSGAGAAEVLARTGPKPRGGKPKGNTAQGKANTKGTKKVRGVRAGADPDSVAMTADAISRRTKGAGAGALTGATVAYSLRNPEREPVSGAEGFGFGRAKSAKTVISGTPVPTSLTGMDSPPMIGQSKSDLAARKAQNQGVDDGEIRRGRGGKYMRRYNANTGRWDIVTATDKTAKKFLKKRNKLMMQSIGAGGSVTRIS